MRKLKIVWGEWRIFVLLCCFLIIGCSEPITDWEQLDDSVIRVMLKKGKSFGGGTAFAINDNGVYVTNHHVIASALSGNPLVVVESTSPALKTHPAKVLWHSQEKDLAIIKVPDWDRPPLTLADEKNVKKNQLVYSIGYPGASYLKMNYPEYTEPKIKNGTISARIRRPIREGFPAVDLFEHSAPINPGNSGGPLVDNCGRVVGINRSHAGTHILPDGKDRIRIDTPQGIFWAIRVNELQHILETEDIDFKLSHQACSGNASSPSIQQIILGLVIAPMLWLIWRCRPQIVQHLSHLGLSGKLSCDKSEPTVKGGIFQKVKIGRGQRSGIKLKSVSGLWPDFIIERGCEMTIGRDPNQVDVAIVHDDVSRRHAQIRLSKSGLLQVMDLNSSNGTYIEHRKIANHRWVTIEHGQSLCFGGGDVIYQHPEAG